ncbi:MAG: hypothetical protein EBR40_10320 [Proteobacteria bacterium]|nr:hypothetical protein [Pseudomonadota bacterium]
MSEHDTQAGLHPPHTDHGAHTAPEEPHPLRKNLWQRWMAWSGSFLVLSILAHVILLGGATVLVVQVVQGRKEKMKFTAPPPSAAGSAEHKVKPSKKTAAAAPAVSKRITSTAANASIALPAMDMSSSAGPDVMASVMSGLGSAGLGSGAGGAGAGGMASMPLTGLTAFGFKGSGGGGLRGHFYDLKQTSDRKPTEITTEASFRDPSTGKYAAGTQAHLKLMDEFFSQNWDEKILQRFYQAKDTMVTYQVFIPKISAAKAPEAFGVEKEVKPAHWVVHYKGVVTAPKDGSYRFLGVADDTLAVRFDGQNVLLASVLKLDSSTQFADKNMPSIKDLGGLSAGKWFQVQRGKSYPIEVLISEVPGGRFQACLMIEERQSEKPYPKRSLGSYAGYTAYPVFQTKKGIPIPPYEQPNIKPPPNAKPDWKPYENAPEVAPDPVVFPGK